VAVTRAMQSLTLSHCAGRMRYGQLMPCHPSRFLKELPPELVEDADAKDKEPLNPDAGKKMFDVLRSAIS
jgi:superfamily I DNA/RNA helicase